MRAFRTTAGVRRHVDRVRRIAHRHHCKERCANIGSWSPTSPATSSWRREILERVQRENKLVAQRLGRRQRRQQSAIPRRVHRRRPADGASARSPASFRIRPTSAIAITTAWSKSRRPSSRRRSPARSFSSGDSFPRSVREMRSSSMKYWPRFHPPLRRRVRLRRRIRRSRTCRSRLVVDRAHLGRHGAVGGQRRLRLGVGARSQDAHARRRDRALARAAAARSDDDALRAGGQAARAGDLARR